jgi:tRNA dimethylallyltransferase
MSNKINKPKIIVILGPTASGKSELAVKLAKKFNGEVISADSRQVYKGLDIGSGKITKKEMRGIKHHLLDVASPKRIFTVSQYQKSARKVIKEILKKGKIPIICGGTGLYIDAVVYNWQLPEIPPQPELRKKLGKLATEELFKKLQKLDPRRAENIDKNNRRRLIRALEIVMITGRPIPPITILSKRSSEKDSEFEILKIGIKKEAEELKQLIRKRLIKRLKQGMIEEVKNLHEKQKVSWRRLDDLGLEYRYVSRYLRNMMSRPRSRASSLRGRQEMISAIEKESYKYAKRQMTWFKRDKNIHWIAETEKAIGLVNPVRS